MDFNFSNLLASFVFGTFGIWLIRESIKKSNLPWSLIGLALLLYTYFISSPWLSWPIGIAFCILAYYLRE